MNFLKLIVILLFFLTGCVDKKNLFDEEIYDRIQFIEKTKDKNLISFAIKNGYNIRYNPNRYEKCIKVNRDIKLIYVPSYTNSEILNELEIIKSLYTAMIVEKFELSEILYEVEQLATYKEIEYLLNNFSIEDIKKDDEIKKEMIQKICMYLLLDDSLDKKIKDETEKIDKLCNYPLNNLNERMEYYLSLKHALENIEGDLYFKTVYNDLLRKVKNGIITYSQAQDIYSKIITLPINELYRTQRIEVNFNIRALTRFKKFYEKEIKKLKDNRNSYHDLINSFDSCYKEK